MQPLFCLNFSKIFEKSLGVFLQKNQVVAIVEECILSGKKTLHIDDPHKCQTLDLLNRFFNPELN